jgi:hypothetical protein
MNRSDAPQKIGSGSAVSSTAKTRLSGSRLILARAVWLALVVPSVGLFVASLPVYFAQLQRACVDPVTCNVAFSLTAQGLRALAALGFSASGYAALLTIFLTIIVAIWSGVGFLIFWRRSDEWFALLSAFFLVMFNITYPGFATSVLALVYPALDVPITFLSVLGLASLALFLVLFPNGRLVPRWMGLFLLLSIISTVSTVFSPDSPFNSNNLSWRLPWWLNGLVNVLVFGAIIFSQVYRYRRVSKRVERQQTKWVVLGIIVVLTGIFVVLPIFTFFFPALNQPNTLAYTIFGMAYPLVLLSIPVTVGIAILRSRLYDIDVLINRTLVYGTLTILLALVYFGLVIGGQHLLVSLLGQSNAVVLVVSTLIVAALFQPLRQRIQRTVDRRFYRSKYDAAKIVAAFSATLRQEVDLDQLREHLLAVVQETMQPAHVSLWLRKTEQERKPRTNVE